MLRKFPCVLVARNKFHVYTTTTIQRRSMSRAYESHVESVQEDPLHTFELLESETFPTARHHSHVRDEAENRTRESMDPLSDFAMLGVRRSVRLALHEAFPNIRTPTACQTEFIPAILSRKDIILKDWTGTGKSFGLVLALLSKERATRPHLSYKEHTTLSKRPITSMVIVPHRDLAFQLMHWIRMLCPHNREDSLDSVAQVCVRGIEDNPLDTQIKRLRLQAPHILIGTPQALMDIMATDKSALQMPTLDTVVLDEVDYLLPVPRLHASQKERWKWDAHPPPTLSIMSALFKDRSKINRESNPKSWRWPPQAIFASATLRHYLRRYLFSKTNWMDRYSDVVKIDFEKDARSSLSPVKHYALVVHKDGAVRNFQLPVIQAEELLDEDSDTEEPDGVEDPVPRRKQTKSPIKFIPDRTVSSELLEAIATVFALDVPKMALLVLPGSAAVKATLAELHDLGVNARSLGLQDNDRGKLELMRSRLKKFNPSPKTRGDDVQSEEPSLLVTTMASIRGLDLPELSHVFVARVPEEDVDYEHAAGRVGRFGRKGKVIMFFENKEKDRVTALYSGLGIRPVEFEELRV